MPVGAPVHYCVREGMNSTFAAYLDDSCRFKPLYLYYTSDQFSRFSVQKRSADAFRTAPSPSLDLRRAGPSAPSFCATPRATAPKGLQSVSHVDDSTSQVHHHCSTTLQPSVMVSCACSALFTRLFTPLSAPLWEARHHFTTP